MLIGPSGCGKTTTMRMINRMIEPDGGTRHGRRPRRHGRRPGRAAPQHRLRDPADRAVPALVDRAQHRDGAAASRLGRRRASRARVDELLALVGMDPAHVPRPLSARAVRRPEAARRRRARARRRSAGDADGRAVRRHRPDHARAAAGRVPAASCARSRKTIVFVTHDIDEAIKMGDRIAILRDGALVQYDTPEAILAAPADAFVESFVGTDRALKRLSLIDARSAMEPASAGRACARSRPTRPCATRWRDAVGRRRCAGRARCARGAAAGSVTLAGVRAGRGRRLTRRGPGPTPARPTSGW